MDRRGAEALAPVVFSDKYVFQPCKTTNIRGPKEPFPSNSSPVSSMGVFFWDKTCWIVSYNENNSNQYEHGKLRFSHYVAHTLGYSYTNISQKNISIISMP